MPNCNMNGAIYITEYTTYWVNIAYGCLNHVAARFTRFHLVPGCNIEELKISPVNMENKSVIAIPFLGGLSSLTWLSLSH